LPPDVNEGQAFFWPAPPPAALPSALPRQPNETAADRQDARPAVAIRFGLVAIKGVGDIAVESIIRAREKGGRLRNLADLCQRVDLRAVNRKTLEALIKCGACDGFGETRATLFVSLDRVLARAAEMAYDRQRGQSSLFGLMDENAPKPSEPQGRLPEWPQHELLAHEKELLGFYVTGHPLAPYAPLL